MFNMNVFDLALEVKVYLSIFVLVYSVWDKSIKEKESRWKACEAIPPAWCVRYIG